MRLRSADEFRCPMCGNRCLPSVAGWWHCIPCGMQWSTDPEVLAQEPGGTLVQKIDIPPCQWCRNDMHPFGDLEDPYWICHNCDNPFGRDIDETRWFWRIWRWFH